MQATDRPQAVGPVDVVLFTVKLYDVDASAATLHPLIGPDTVVITLQNGVERWTWWRSMSAPITSPAARRISWSWSTSPATCGTPPRIAGVRRARQPAIGTPRRPSKQACTRAGFKGKASTDVQTDLWVKFIRLSTWSGMTTVTRSPMGVVRDDPALFKMMMDAIDEAIAVGRARGITFRPTSSTARSA